MNRDDVEFEIFLHEEEDSPRGHFSDPKDAERVMDQLEDGNEWAWCLVEVRATLCGDWGDNSASAWLGACSYEDEETFRAGDYFADLCDEAYEALVDRLRVAGLIQPEGSGAAVEAFLSHVAEANTLDQLDGSRLVVLDAAVVDALVAHLLKAL